MHSPQGRNSAVGLWIHIPLRLFLVQYKHSWLHVYIYIARQQIDIDSVRNRIHGKWVFFVLRYFYSLPYLLWRTSFPTLLRYVGLSSFFCPALLCLESWIIFPYPGHWFIRLSLFLQFSVVCSGGVLLECLSLKQLFVCLAALCSLGHPMGPLDRRTWISLRKWEILD